MTELRVLDEADAAARHARNDSGSDTPAQQTPITPEEQARIYLAAHPQPLTPDTQCQFCGTQMDPLRLSRPLRLLRLLRIRRRRYSCAGCGKTALRRTH